MKPGNFHFLLLTFLLFACHSGKENRPIALHPENPHYFTYKDKPTVLITSAEHYGAVLNLDFDYVTYLESLAAESLNFTRIFTGAYVEPSGAFRITKNTLAPEPGRFICPWPRSETPGYANGGHKFDLTQWDDEYFYRLKDFISEAEKRNIIVEVTLFCPFYGDTQWKVSPMNPINNINGNGTQERTHVYTLDKSSGLLAVQENLVRKIIHELKDYNNLFYEICNEPYFGGVTMEWQHHIAALIHAEEKELSRQHLIAQNIANKSAEITYPHPAVSVFNFHYATPPVAVAQNYRLNKVIGDDETGFIGNADSTYRKEGWAFILAGGGLFNNLDYSFTAEHEDGTFQYPSTQPGGGSAALRKQLSFLQKFINSFQYLQMKPDSAVIRNSGEIKNAHVLAEPGKQYAIYAFGAGPRLFDLAVPSGSYTVQFMDPLKGTFDRAERVTSNGNLSVTSPAYAEDVAIRITAAPSK